MISSFRAAAFVSEGFCPLCDRRLREPQSNPFAIVGQRTGDCEPCNVEWAVVYEDHGRPFGVAATNRPLVPDEIRKLYASVEPEPA